MGKHTKINHKTGLSSGGRVHAMHLQGLGQLQTLNITT